MKKTTLALAIALAAVTSAANAAAPSGSFYVGGKLGWSKFMKTKANQVAADSNAVINKTKTNDIGGGLFAGYQANKYFAVELGYDYLGKAKYQSPNTSDGKIEAHGAQLTLKGSYPLSFITPDLDIYARAGLFVSTAKYTPVGDNGHTNKTDVAPVYALGLDYSITDSLSTRLEYQYVDGIRYNKATPGSNYGKVSNGLLSLGLVYNFGAPAPAPVKRVVEEATSITLNEDVLFAFGKSNLKPEGQAALTALLGQLQQVNPTSGHIEVVGHTDRIGSEAYNLKLSQQRADSVRNFLVAQGVPANIITARGVGKAQPVTGTQCNGVTPKAKLIACLAPDRRVVININAESMKEVVIYQDTTK